MIKVIRSTFTQDEKDLLASGNFVARWRHGSYWKRATVKDRTVCTSSLTITEYVHAENGDKTTRSVRYGEPVRLYPGESRFYQTWALKRDELVEWATGRLLDTSGNAATREDAQEWADGLLASPGAFALTNGATFYVYVWDNGKGADVESQVPVS